MTRIAQTSLIFAAGILLSSSTALGAVGNKTYKWQPDTNGITTIPVCIIDGSSAAQRGYGVYWGYVHDPNPSLNDVLRRVRQVLRETWQRYSSVEFTDWRSCGVVANRSQYVGLYINSDADNNAWVGTLSRGRTTRDDRGVQFKPFGNSFNSCVTYSWSKARMEYRFDCVEQYAIHEFGHVLGFEHEWRHPERPSGCAERAGEGTLPPSVRSSYYLTAGFDRNSIMVYDTDCANVQGVRFGNTRLSPRDVEAVNAMYSTPQWLLTRKVALRTSAGYYLTAEGGGGNNQFSTNRRAIGAWEEFDLVPVNNTKPNQYGLRTSFGTYVHAVSAGGVFSPNPLKTDAAWLLWMEHFGLVRMGGDNVALRTPNGVNVVTAEANGGVSLAYAVTTNRTAIGPWETFTLQYRPAAHMVHDPATGKVSVVYQGRRRHIPNPETLIALGFRWEEVTNDARLAALPEGAPYPVLTTNLIRQPATGAVYILEQGLRRGIPDMDTFIKMGLSWSSVRDVPDTTLTAIPLGPLMPKL
jgi:hypothetical protein